MSYQILVQDLRRKSEEKIKTIWDEAKREAEEVRTEKRRALEHEIKISLSRIKDVERDAVTPILLEADRKSLWIRDKARKKLADRLYLLATQLLGQLREGGYEILFSGLVKELPVVRWQKVRVNPLDRKLAEQFFQDAEIVTDKDIVGGFEAVGDSGAFRVIDTLEKRLDKAFPHVLPLLMRIILEQDDATAAL